MTITPAISLSPSNGSTEAPSPEAPFRDAHPLEAQQHFQPPRPQMLFWGALSISTGASGSTTVSLANYAQAGISQRRPLRRLYRFGLADGTPAFGKQIAPRIGSPAIVGENPNQLFFLS